MHEADSLTSGSPKPRILVVEDDASLCRSLRRLLSDEYIVDTASNGREALTAVLQAPPLLVMADIIMPELGGIGLLKALRGVRRTQMIPVLLVSGVALDEQRIEGFEEGADGYLAKPYTERELRACIRSMLQSAHRRNEAARRDALEQAEQQALADRATLLESITDAFYALDREFRFTYLNQRAVDHFGATREALLGKVPWDVFPITRGTVFQHEYERAVHERCSVAFEAVSLLSSRWVEVRAYPTPQGLAVYFRDITDRKQAEEQLREADRRKSEFLAVLAHELRNPLAPLRNGLYSLKLRSDTDPVVSQTVSMMDRQMTHLVRLVDDLLDVSRITSGKLELRRQKVLLTEVLGSAVEASRAFIEAHQHELVLDLRVQNVWVDGDPDRLAQVFSNLLFNSAKYTERGGRITLTLKSENSETVVTVQDNGIGIPPSAFEEVFDMFSQVRTHEALAMDGLGIGLSLVRTLVQRHGGSVLVFSEGLGKGSRFTVRLPIVEAPVATLDEVPLLTAHPPGQRVLVVDDNSDAATSLALLLEMENCEVRTAADGEEALAQVEAFQPELIFMDLAMPRLDGVAATRRIRAMPQCQRVRIVALTGWGQATDRQRTREAGMDHHLIKPVSLDDLRSVLAATDRG
ncbi:MAG TPA: response regulator [Acidobacteriaceae bacterium]|jgi:PAS domain S-box-containing protein|nr:response regulator [Acidobacteriaceae bacterium]